MHLLNHLATIGFVLCLLAAFVVGFIAGRSSA